MAAEKAEAAQRYDYVIVGSGSAGAVLAARLTEDAQVTVLLLEAGRSDDALEIRIPAAFSALFGTQWDWNYHTSPQRRLGGRRAFWPRMKALGGCSSMNAMIYIRGNAADYDSWRDQHGALGWGYRDVLPYFIRSESNSRLSGPFHGQDGPLRVEDRRFTHELSAAWVESAVAAGHKPNDDFNGAEQNGAGLFQVTCRRGRRWSVADGYLRPALHRSNLTVHTGAFVHRILFDRGRAVGVAYRRGGRDTIGRADAEVILSAGAINSPQLLMLSGIGPSAHLGEHGVPVEVDLPGVGSNLHDHPAVPLIWHTRGVSDLAQKAGMGSMVRWGVSRTGPLTSNVGEAGAFLCSSPELVAPDIQVHVAPSGFYDNALHEPTAPMVTAAPTLVSVHSRGSIRLRSDRPDWHPEIDPAYLDDPADRQALLAGMRAVIDIVHQGPLAKLIQGPVWPATNTPTDADLLEHIERFAQTLYHPVGTCKMGDTADAVVDPCLKVIGVERLRVVDASVMPAVPRGNTHAPTVMIAEKAADLIRADR